MTLLYFHVYNKKVYKNFDEDSRIYMNVQESRRRWDAGTSKIYLNITSELQTLKGPWKEGKIGRASCRERV